MRYIVFAVVVTAVMILLVGCTESSTQWAHQKQQHQACLDTAATVQERDDCGSE